MLSRFMSRSCGVAAIILLVCASCLRAQTPGQSELTQAYEALANKDYDTAVDLFRKGLAKQPDNPGAHKDLAYTLLKTGDNSEARDEFQAALKLNQSDETAALEFAFLAYETQKPIEARRMFDRLRKRGTAATRATAEQAFQNIDRPLAEGIDRWKQALATAGNPNDVAMFSAHWELARLAELRDDLPLAAEQYEVCRKLKPQMSEILLILARVWQQLNRVEEARAALLAASREKDSRTAELALAQLGTRYPYPYEFAKALDIDPQNVALRRELAYLYLAMHQEPEAVAQLERILALDPHDELSRRQLDAIRGAKSRTAAQAVTPVPTLLTRGTASDTPLNIDAKAMGLKSFALGYSRDAIKYLSRAHEENPDDAEVMLKLAYAYNYAHDDLDALQWFDRARHASDPKIAAEAGKAFHNLNGDAVAQTTVWTLPMYSSRWRDLFSYGQIKRTVPLPWKTANNLISLYFSTRFIGDLRSSMPQNPIAPQYLSDSAFIVAAGVSTKTWHHVTGWAEAGESLKYIPFRHDVGAAVPDYRGGVNYAKGFGHLLGSPSAGAFFEGTGDAIYISRYDKDWIFISQNRSGWTFHLRDQSAEVLFNANYTHDLKNQYWAETVEVGPGLKLHMPWMRPGVYVSADFLRGVYTNNLGNPRRPNYDDIRVGLWYAFTK